MGCSLVDALKKIDDPPAYETVIKWLGDDKYKDFTRNYARAREAQADWDADHLRVLAVKLEGAKSRDEADGIDKAAKIYMWLTRVRKPKVYGDSQKLEHTGGDGGPIQINLIRGVDPRKKGGADD